jgi:PAS domain S-box-containing protein
MPINRMLDAAHAAVPDVAREALLELVGPCVATTPAGVITQASAAAGELLRIAPEQLVGKPFQALGAPELRQSLAEQLALVAEGRVERRTFTTRLERNGAVAFDAEVRAARVGVAGTEAMLLLAFRDMTDPWELNALLERRIAEGTLELEQASDELDRRRSYLETIVQHIPAGLIIADAQTGDITLANERSLEIGGQASALPMQEAWASARGTRADGKPYGPDDWPLARALAGEEVLRERVVLHTGRRTVLEVNAAPIRDSRGTIVAAVGLFQDVTDADMRLRAASEFVANAAHELRTPLAAIVSGVEVLAAGAKDIPAERDRFLGHIAREADRLTRLSAALLQLARVQSGLEAPRTEVVPLGPVLAAVAGGLRPAEGVRVSVRCPTGAAALASRGLLEQALTSIAANATRYTDEGRITLSVAQPNGRVRIRVRDTGRGMGPEALDRAGERFYRADPTGPAGFGLGLAIARQSVEAMGGSLVLASEVGQGTTVDVVLPAAQVVSA